MAGEFVFVLRIGVAMQLGGWVIGTDHGPCESAEPSQDGGHGIPVQLVSWMTGAVHAVAAAVSVVIGVPAILLEGVVMLAISVAKPTGSVTLMACAPVGGSDCNTGIAGMCTV